MKYYRTETLAVNAYDEGYRAFGEGKTETDCPHPHTNGFNNKRVRWFNGWYDAKLKPLHERLDRMIRP